MKDWELADEFRRIFAADVDNFPAASINLATGQSSPDYKTPCIIFGAACRAIDGCGRVLAYSLSVWIDSDPRDPVAASAADHAARVASVQRKFFGADAAGLGAAKTAMQAAMATGGKFTIKNYDSPPESSSDPSVEAHRFRSLISIAGIALVTGNV